MKIRLVLPVFVLALASALALTACGGSGGGSDGPTVAQFCDSYLNVQDKTNALSDASNGSLEDRKKALGDFAGSLSDLASNSPKEIRDDVQETADWATGAEEAVADADTVEAFQTAGAAYGKDNPQPDAASQKADQYEHDNCEEGDSSSGDSTSSGDTTG